MLKYIAILFVIAITCAMAVHADEEKVTEELLFDLEDIQIDIATLTPKKISEAPAVVTVITSEQIRDAGARNLYDVLSRVPGIVFGRYSNGQTLSIGMRGIRSHTSEKVLVLLDGHPVKDLWSGGGTWYEVPRLPLYYVDKVEIIRGPGSALYGANAYIGVINIISKKGKDINGSQIRAAVGSFDTAEASIISGTKKNDFQISYHSSFRRSNGIKGFVETDKASVPGPSSAPGFTKDGMKQVDVGLKADYKNIFMQLRYFDSFFDGAFLSAGPVVQDDTTFQRNALLSELGYNAHFMQEKLNIKWKGYFDYYHEQNLWEFRDDGFLGVFPGGLKMDLADKGKVLGTELRANYKLFENHEVVVGAMYEHNKQFGIKTSANFDPITSIPFDSMRDVSSFANWQREAARHLFAVYLQDTWDILKFFGITEESFGITAGVRSDDYSDIGKTLSSRLGGVYRFINNGYLKLLYATAFRAPSFGEMYTDNNPTLIGSPDAKPEKIQTFEIATGYRFSPLTNFNINYFHNEFSDSLVYTKWITFDGTLSTKGFWDNTGNAKSDGVEAEFKTGLNKNITTYLNYAYVFIETKDNNIPLTFAFQFFAKHKVNVGFRIKVFKNIIISPNFYYVSKINREQGDDRVDPMPGYGIVDLNIRTLDLLPDTEFSLAFSNLFDKQYYDPAQKTSNLNPGLPRPGFALMGTVRFKF